MKTICGIDCRECTHKDNCKGCVETNGHPLGGECVAVSRVEKSVFYNIRRKC